MSADGFQDDGFALNSVFPEEDRPPSPEPSVAVYERNVKGGGKGDWREIKVRLVGDHPLWGHHLWNASRAFGTYLDHHSEIYKDRRVLELGAGGGLPGIVTALNGATKVVLTDYPDDALTANLEYNVDENVRNEDIRKRVAVEGYVWGKNTKPLLEAIRTSQDIEARYELIILSDLVFNHSQHDALLTTCEGVIAPSQPESKNPAPQVLVFFTHHRPHLAHKDMVFFEKAKERGWRCEEILTERFSPMFPEDSGDEEVRSTVHGWRLTRL